MGFNTWPFLIYSILIFIIYWIIPINQLRYFFLILAGLFFVFYHFPLNTVIYSIFALTIFLIGFLIDHSRRDQKGGSYGPKGLLITGILLSLFFLFFYKYKSFIFGSLINIGIPLPSSFSKSGEFFQYLIPIGISFFTFEVIHWLVEIYKSNIVKPKFNEFLIFVFFFPTMTAGPIKRFNDFCPQLDLVKFPKFEDFLSASGRIILGLSKKVLVADFLVKFANLIFTNFNFFTPWQLLLAIYLFSLVIYLDFSGYSDVAIGISRLLGFKIPENFNSPYTKSNISDFWANWHISLTSWVKDYLFMPMGGSRVGFGRYLINILFVFSLIGLWHGASWNFIFWGLYHGLGSCFYQGYRKAKEKTKIFKSQINIASQIAGIFLTFNFVSFGWVLFKMDLVSTLAFWRAVLFSQIGLVLLALNMSASVIILLRPNLGQRNSYSIILKGSSIIARTFERRFMSVEIKSWCYLVFFSVITYFLLLFFSESTVPYIYEQF